MATVYTILRSEANTNNLKTLYLCVSIGKDRKYYSLKREIDAKYWNDQTHKVKPNEGNSTFLNNLILKKEGEVLNIFQQFEFEAKHLSMSNFHAIYKGGKSLVNPCFFGFFDDEIKIQESSISPETKKIYCRTRDKLKLFAPNLTLVDINHDLITRFNSYLHGLGLDSNTVCKHLSIFRTYVKSAYNKGLIKNYPFSAYKLKKGNSNRLYLTEPEVKAISDVRLWNDGEAYVKKMYLFACYTGLRFSDLISIKWEHIQSVVGRNGVQSKIISLKQEKTGLKVEIPLIKEALDILNTLEPTTLYIFKTITNQKFNEHLKTIQKKAEITKNLSAHIARHTFATLALNKGIPLEIVSSLLGHTSLKTTQIYAKLMNSTKIEEMKKFTLGVES